MDNDTAALLSWFREWPWAAQSGETLSDEECQAIRDVILERDAQAAEIAALKMCSDEAEREVAALRAALAAAEARVAVPEKVQSQDWENAAHELLWANGQQDTFYTLQSMAGEEAAARAALKGGAA
jgi:hypothetical protein